MSTSKPPRDWRYWIDQLGSANPIVRMQAVVQVLPFASQSASIVSAVKSPVLDESRGVRAIAEWGLTSLSKERPAEASIRLRLAACREHAGAPNIADVILPVIVEGLHSSDSSDRVQALRLIRLLGRDAQPLLPTIEQFLHDESYLVQLAALLVIASPSLGYPDTVIRELLEPMTTAENQLVREAATKTIG